MVHKHSETLHNYKKNEIMQFCTTWMDLENTILSEVREGMGLEGWHSGKAFPSKRLT